MELNRRTLLLGSAGAVALGAAGSQLPAAAAGAPSWTTRDAAIARFSGQKPTYWGMFAPGVKTRFSTATSAGKDAIVLTFDACGGSVTRYDSALIATLRANKVPATLFINRHWAENNVSTFKALLADPLFDVQNHGWAHTPLSVTGRSAYGIKGTTSVASAWSEIAACDWYMQHFFGHTPRFMRAGTAYTDDVAARMATFMGQTLVSYSVNADAGASFPAATVYSETIKAKPGDIVIGHFNHPGSGTAAGIARAIPALKARGLKFRTLSQVF